MNAIYTFWKNIFRKRSKPEQSNIKQINKAGFDLADKPKNLEEIRSHFDKLNLYSYFDIEILQDENELQLDKIELGIVAGFAVWSGYSYSISNQILNEIKDATKPKIRLLIIDTDYFSAELQKKLFGTVMHGYFECCLIVNGEITQRHTYSIDVNPFIEAVRKYLKK